MVPCTMAVMCIILMCAAVHAILTCKSVTKNYYLQPPATAVWAQVVELWIRTNFPSSAAAKSTTSQLF